MERGQKQARGLEVQAHNSMDQEVLGQYGTYPEVKEQYGTYPEAKRKHSRYLEAQGLYGMDPNQYTYFERQYVTDLSSSRPQHHAKNLGSRQVPGILQKRPNINEFSTLPYLRSLPLEKQLSAKPPQKTEKEKRRGREDKREREVIYNEMDHEKMRETALVAKETRRKLEKDHERKKRKELAEEAVTSRSPTQSRKHRKKERVIEQAWDQDMVYEDWEPLQQVRQRRPSRARVAPYDLVPGQENRRREGTRARLPRDSATRFQWRKLELDRLQKAGYRTIYSDGWEEEEGLYEETEGPAKYDAYSVKRFHDPSPQVNSRREHRSKQKRILIRPPPYVPPPAYTARHRTFSAQRRHHPLKAIELRRISLDDKTSSSGPTRAPSVQVGSNSHELNDVHSKLIPSHNFTNEATEAKGQVGLKKEKEAETEKRKTFNQIYKSLMGWKVSQGFGTRGGSSKRQEEEVKSKTQKAACLPQVEKVEDIYETIEFESVSPKPKSAFEKKSRSTSPPKLSRPGIQSRDGRAFCLVFNHNKEDLPTAKSFTLPRAAKEPHWHGQDMVERFEEQDMPTEIRKKMVTRERNVGKLPKPYPLMLKEDERQKNNFGDYEDIAPYSPVKPTPRVGPKDELPYDWGLTYASNQPQFARRRMAFQELSNNRDLAESTQRYPVQSVYAREPKIQDQADFEHAGGRMSHYSQTLPRRKPPLGMVAVGKQFLYGRRRSLEQVEPVLYGGVLLENVEQRRVSRHDPSHPRWMEQVKANTLPRQTAASQSQCEKDFQQFRTSSDSPRARSHQNERRPASEQPPEWTETSESFVKENQTSKKESNGMFVIDATCVLIRAEYIFPPKKEQVKYLHQGGTKISDDKRKPDLTCLSERDQQSPANRDDKHSVRSPCQKRILNKQLGHQLEMPGLETNNGWSTSFLHSSRMERSDPFPVFKPHVVQERASKILGLPVIDLEHTLEVKPVKSVNSECSTYRPRGSNLGALSQAKEGDYSHQNESIRNQNKPQSSKYSTSGPANQQGLHAATPAQESQQESLLKENSLGKINFSAETEMSEEHGDHHSKGTPLFTAQAAPGNQCTRRRQMERGEPGSLSVTEEPVAECRLSQKMAGESGNEPCHTKEKGSTGQLVASLVENNIANGMVEEDSNQAQEHPELSFPREAEPKKADVEQSSDLEEEDTWDKSANITVRGITDGGERNDQVSIQEQVYLQDALPKETGTTEVRKERPLAQFHVEGTNVKKILVTDEVCSGSLDEVIRCTLQEDRYDTGSVHQKILPTSDFSKAVGSVVVDSLPGCSSSGYTGRAAPILPSTKRRGFYAKDLHEAVSRIRRHTAPDSDSDDEQEHEPPIGERTASQKIELLQTECQEKDTMVYSSSESNDSDATVIMRDSEEKKDPDLELEEPSHASSTDAVSRWLVINEQVQEKALQPSESNDLGSEPNSSAATLAPPPQNHPGTIVTTEAGPLFTAKKPGPDLSACIEEILQELTQAEIDFFGTAGADQGSSTDPTDHLAE
ncbi:dendrin [Lissotriton helveticus]